MNKRQLVTVAARHSTLTRRQMGEALDVILETIITTLSTGDYVALSNFGRFEMKDYPGRVLSRFNEPGHYVVEGRQIPAFKSSKALRRRLRGES